MKGMKRVLVSLPVGLKRKLDGMKAQGYTASGFIRALLERELGPTHSKSKGS